MDTLENRWAAVQLGQARQTPIDERASRSASFQSHAIRLVGCPGDYSLRAFTPKPDRYGWILLHSVGPSQRCHRSGSTFPTKTSGFPARQCPTAYGHCGCRKAEVIPLGSTGSSTLQPWSRPLRLPFVPFLEQLGGRTWFQHSIGTSTTLGPIFREQNAWFL